MAQDPETVHAVTLDRLLDAADTQGLEWEIKNPQGMAMPVITGIASLSNASAQSISFLSNPKFFEQLATTKAAAVMLPARALEHLPSQTPFLVVCCENPYLLYSRLSQWFEKQRLAGLSRTVHPAAVIHESARIGKNVSIGPHVVIEENVHIDDGATIGPACVIARDCQIGADSVLHARVTLYANVRMGQRCIIHSGAVLGADGFGFAPDATHAPGGWSKIVQFGGVKLGNDVEIGANTTVDRGALDDTVIGNGVKLDNLIMIGHNVQIGDHTAMAGCAGVAGSTTIGSRCTIAGAAMISGHIKLADDVHISGGTAVISDVSKPGRYTGVFPLAEHAVWQKNAAVLMQLAQLRRRIRDLKKA
ncbi:UDP-3-O-(3-hydroxymyristoyl)glucosamine N-acyltransferase [Advenella sp. S44]|nr:UDP-3-O-(3-hydroxymyristoyl)glucosamine N-acyltransferase [Advenella sp. S44]